MSNTITASTSDVSVPLALKYRPRRLSEVVGQRHVTVVLGRANASGRMPQQLLFSGSSGLGKTTVARIAAAAVLCETPMEDRSDPADGIVGDACGHCETCLDVTSPTRTHPDVIEFDAASHGGKDDVRDIAARAATAPMRGSRKIYIIDEAHGLTAHGGQAFLKLLEEPPPHVMFMLATTDPHKMLSTNRGRCVEFEMLRPSDEEISAHLISVADSEGWQIDADTAAAVLAATDPALGLRGALMTLAKLAPALAWGLTPDPDELAQMLAIAPTSVVDDVLSAALAGDVPAALGHLDAARAKVSDAAIRRGLLGRARAQWRAVATDPSAEPLARARVESLAGAPAGDLWTDLAVSSLASPVTPAIVAHLEQLVAAAADLAAGAPTPAQPAGPPPAAAAAPSRPAAEPTSEPTRSAKRGPAAPAETSELRAADRPAAPAEPTVRTPRASSASTSTPAPAPASDPAPSAPAASSGSAGPGDVAAAVDAVCAATPSKVASQMLRSLAASGAVTLDGSTLAVRPPSSMSGPFARHRSTLAAAVTAAGFVFDAPPAT